MKALLIGAAVSGRAALGLLEADGFEVLVYDADPAAVADLGAGRQVHGGSWDPALLAGADLVVTSPGVPPTAAPLAGCPVVRRAGLG